MSCSCEVEVCLNIAANAFKNLSVLLERLSDAICIAYVTHLQIVISEKRRKRSERVPARMHSDIRGVSLTSGGVCHPSRSRGLLLFPGLLQSVKNWCQHLSEAKCLFYTECQSSHNLLINKPAKKQILFMCVCGCVCMWAQEQQAKTHLGLLFSHC